MKRKERWKSGWYQFSSDLDRALGQGIFLAAVLVIAAAIILPGGKDLFVDAEKIAKGLEAGYTSAFSKGIERRSRCISAPAGQHPSLCGLLAG